MTDRGVQTRSEQDARRTRCAGQGTYVQSPLVNRQRRAAVLELKRNRYFAGRRQEDESLQRWKASLGLGAGAAAKGGDKKVRYRPAFA
jgi:hypothetical protein